MQTTPIVKAAAWLIVLTLSVIILMEYRTILQPFVIALIIWYLISLLRQSLRKIPILKLKAPEWYYSLSAFLIIILVVFAVTELLINNIEQINGNLNQYRIEWQPLLEQIKANPYFESLAANLEGRLIDFDYQKILGPIISSLSSILGNTVLILIYVVFLLIEENIFDKKLHHIFRDQEKQARLSSSLNQINRSISKYVGLKTQTSLLTGVLSYMIMMAFGLDFPFLWAFLIFTFNYIPYVGSLIATLLPSFFALIQFGSISTSLFLFVSIEMIQLLVGNYIEPRLMGRGLNLSPLVVILSLTFWGSVWGVLGMMLSVPIMSVLVIFMSGFESSSQLAKFLSSDGQVEGNKG